MGQSRNIVLFRIDARNDECFCVFVQISGDFVCFFGNDVSVSICEYASEVLLRCPCRTVGAPIERIDRGTASGQQGREFSGDETELNVMKTPVPEASEAGTR